jgi:hypothetical protein
MTKPLRSSMLVLAVALPAAAVTRLQAQAQTSPPDVLYTMSVSSLNASDKLLMTTLQGLVARNKPEIWLRRSETNMWLDELKSNHGVTEVSLPGVDAFLDQFRSHINGYVLCDIGEASQNVAASLAGLWNAVAATPVNENRMTSRNISNLADVRGRDDAWLNSNYGTQFNKNVLFEQALGNPDLCSFLYDLATYRQGQIIYQGVPASSLRRTIAGSLNDHSPVYGWSGGHEKDWVVDLSQSTSGGVAADAWHNGTVLVNVPLPLPITQNTRIPAHEETADDAHYACFIISDGDNIQWYQRNFYNNNRWWASPHRGTFNVGWEMNPLLAEAGPIIMKKLYDTASTGTHKDYFISGPYGYLLMSPDYYPSDKLSEYAQLLEPRLANADLRIVNVIMYRESWLSMYRSRLNSVLDLPDVIGLTVKLSGSNYAKGDGQIYWRNGKPAVNYKYFMGPGRSSPGQVANGINGRPRSPNTNIDSYTLIAVNAWSDNPMQDIKDCINQLHADVQVVTPDVFFYHMRKHFGVPFDPQDTQPPSVPTGVQATALSSSSISVSWTASSDNVGVAGYKVFRDGHPEPIGTTASTNYLDAGLEPETAYSYRVSAYDHAQNESEKSVEATAATRSPYAAADLDRDGDVDQEDFGIFQVCYSGIPAAPPSAICMQADFDGDGIVNQQDCEIFLSCFSDPGLSADPDCGYPKG